MDNQARNEDKSTSSYSLPSGFPSPAADYLENRIDLNKEFIPHPLSTFIVEVEGDSMIDAFIPPTAKLIVDRSVKPKNGDIIVAVLNGEFTIRCLQKIKQKCWLIPANKKYKQLEVTPEMDMQVWGVVTHIISIPKNTVACMH